MKILVTGGHGLIGKNLQEYIKRVGDNNIWLFPSSSELQLMNGNNIDKYFSLNAPDFVIHLAANVGGLYKNLKYKVEMFRDNIIMNENILYYCNKYNINNGIFFCSTCIYPANPISYPMTENMIMCGEPHQSNESYGYAKRFLYFQCKNYNEQYGRKYICITPTNLFGKYDNFELNTSHVIGGVIHKFYLANNEKSNLTIKTGYDSYRQFLYAVDLCKIIVLFINDFDKIDFDNIILCDQEILITDIIKLISAKFPSVEYTIENIECGQSKKTCSNELFNKKYPDYKFENISDSLNNTIDWFVNNYNNVRK